MTVEMPLGPMLDMPDRTLLERLRRLAPSLISDAFGRWAGAPGIMPIALPNSEPLTGPAFTVRTRAGDNLAVHQALDLARPGEIVIVAAGGATDRAILGEHMAHYSSTRGIAGLIIDGAIRDRRQLEQGSIPVFAQGVSHLGPYKEGPGALRCPVSISGLPVADGDLVLGDEDGVAVIPRRVASEVIQKAEHLAATEDTWRSQIRQGKWDRSWLTKTIKIKEVESY